jgi:hypothetical protein
MLSGRRNRPTRASEYVAGCAVGIFVLFEAVLPKSAGRAPAEVTALAKGAVTNGRGNSLGKYPLVNRSTSGRVRLTSSGLTLGHRDSYLPKFGRILLITLMVSFGKSLESIHSK